MIAEVRALAAAFGAGLILLGIAGCGVTAQSHPRKLANAPTSTVAPPEGRITRLTDIYLVSGNALVVVHRAVPVPANLQQTVQALLSGPTTAEAAQGLRSALPGGIRVTQLFLSDSTATVGLTGDLSAIDSQEQSLAIAQLVFTVTATPGVRDLRVLVDGDAVEVPRADGTLTSGELNRTDYRTLLKK